MAFFLVFLVTLSTVDSWAPPGKSSVYNNRTCARHAKKSSVTVQYNLYIDHSKGSVVRKKTNFYFLCVCWLMGVGMNGWESYCVCVTV
jgi:hypothetical protein